MSGKRAVLLGATGLVGGHCLDLLARESAYARVVSLVRREVPPASEKHDVSVIDFGNPSSYERLFQACDDVYCCLGTTIKKAGSQSAFRTVDYTYPLQVAERATRAGVHQFLLVSALGANPESGVFYNRVKGELERDLQKLGLRALHI